MKRCKRCCLWALPLALLLGLLVPFLAKGSIDQDFANAARKAMTDNGLDGVWATSNWGRVKLHGPAALKAEALAAAQLSMKHYKDKRSIDYLDDGSAAPTTTTATTAAPATTPTTAAPTTVATTAAPTTVATTAPTTVAPTTTVPIPVSVDVKADSAAKTITLTGYVASDGERQALVDAATAAYGAANVVDQLQVRAGSPATGVDNAVAQLAKVISVFGANVDTGTATLKDTTLTVTGTAFNPGAADTANGVVAGAGSAGVTVSGTITKPAAPDATALQAQLRDLLGRTNIHFASGSAAIDAASDSVLQTAAQSILQVPGVKIEVGGHTDNVGSAASNQSLSQKRADAVRNRLVDLGVPGDQLTAVGYGPTKPVAANDTEEGRAANRRIEFTVQGS